MCSKVCVGLKITVNLSPWHHLHSVLEFDSVCNTNSDWLASDADLSVCWLWQHQDVLHCDTNRALAVRIGWVANTLAIIGRHRYIARILHGRARRRHSLSEQHDWVNMIEDIWAELMLVNKLNKIAEWLKVIIRTNVRIQKTMTMTMWIRNAGVYYNFYVTV